MFAKSRRPFKYNAFALSKRDTAAPSSCSFTMAHNEKQADDGTLHMRVEKSLSDAFALSNYVTIAPGQVDPSEHYLLVNNEFVFTAR